MSVPRLRPAVIVWLILALSVLAAGWKIFWFLTDDAYISFRYISNHLQGHGWVWNPPPFRAVEGYTNFLWMVLLEAVWRVLGIPPPESCNVLSLFFSVGSLVLTAVLAGAVSRGEAGRPSPAWLTGLLLLGVATNRTFLTWSSSGLETAMFNFLLLLWVALALTGRPGRPARIPLLASTAALAYLTRPDGVLLAAATPVLLWLSPGRRTRRRWIGLLPLLAVPLHLLWRHGFYGEWLPNSYYAKTVGAWPESGWRYATSFVLEYALWLWIPPLLMFLRHRIVSRRRRETGPPGPDTGTGAALILIILCLGGHFLYYTLIVGGDHFEYRVYSHLIPLLFISLPGMTAALSRGPAVPGAFLAAALLLSLPVPYTHWALSRHLDTRRQTFQMKVPVSPAWPGPFRWYAEVFDRQQAWLIDHYVCMRHQEHKVNLEFVRSVFPPRDEEAGSPGDPFPILVFPAVGYAAWALPRINILDSHGLNDYVIARTPVDPSAPRAMAHDRQPPPGYLQCFSPNVRLLPGARVEITPRASPLTAEDIRNCEETWAGRVTGR